MTKQIRVTIWNENVHESEQTPLGELCRSYYPCGIHNYLKEVLQAEDLEIRAVSLDMPEQGLPQEDLESTDVLMWWGHCAHARVEDALVDRIQARVLDGMGLIVMHSGHYSKIFKRMMGTTCSLHWREVGEKERLWKVARRHPIYEGVPETFVIPNSEMYGESFDIPDDGKVLFLSWYEGGNVFRSGVTFLRGNGKIFYFSPGHETFPVYHNENVQRILGNAIRWAAPDGFREPWKEFIPEGHEKISTPNPLANLDTSALHKAQ